MLNAKLNVKSWIESFDSDISLDNLNKMYDSMVNILWNKLPAKNKPNKSDEYLLKKCREWSEKFISDNSIPPKVINTFVKEILNKINNEVKGWSSLSKIILPYNFKEVIHRNLLDSETALLLCKNKELLESVEIEYAPNSKNTKFIPLNLNDVNKFLPLEAYKYLSNPLQYLSHTFRTDDYTWDLLHFERWRDTDFFLQYEKECFSYLSKCDLDKDMNFNKVTSLHSWKQAYLLYQLADESQDKTKEVKFKQLFKWLDKRSKDDFYILYTRVKRENTFYKEEIDKEICKEVWSGLKLEHCNDDLIFKMHNLYKSFPYEWVPWLEEIIKNKKYNEKYIDIYLDLNIYPSPAKILNYVIKNRTDKVSEVIEKISKSPLSLPIVGQWLIDKEIEDSIINSAYEIFNQTGAKQDDIFCLMLLSKRRSFLPKDINDSALDSLSYNNLIRAIDKYSTKNEKWELISEVIDIEYAINILNTKISTADRSDMSKDGLTLFRLWLLNDSNILTKYLSSAIYRRSYSESAFELPFPEKAHKDFFKFILKDERVTRNFKSFYWAILENHIDLVEENIDKIDLHSLFWFMANNKDTTSTLDNVRLSELCTQIANSFWKSRNFDEQSTELISSIFYSLLTTKTITQRQAIELNNIHSKNKDLGYSIFKSIHQSGCLSLHSDSAVAIYELYLNKLFRNKLGERYWVLSQLKLTNSSIEKIDKLYSKINLDFIWSLDGWWKWEVTTKKQTLSKFDVDFDNPKHLAILLIKINNFDISSSEKTHIFQKVTVHFDDFMKEVDFYEESWRSMPEEVRQIFLSDIVNTIADFNNFQCSKESASSFIEFFIKYIKTYDNKIYASYTFKEEWFSKIAKLANKELEWMYFAPNAITQASFKEITKKIDDNYDLFNNFWKKQINSALFWLVSKGDTNNKENLLLISKMLPLADDFAKVQSIITLIASAFNYDIEYLNNGKLHNNIIVLNKEDIVTESKKVVEKYLKNDYISALKIVLAIKYNQTLNENSLQPYVYKNVRNKWANAVYVPVSKQENITIVEKDNYWTELKSDKFTIFQDILLNTIKEEWNLDMENSDNSQVFEMIINLESYIRWINTDEDFISGIKSDIQDIVESGNESLFKDILKPILNLPIPTVNKIQKLSKLLTNWQLKKYLEFVS